MELLSLPNEILDKIIGFIPLSSLSSLHLTCKTLSLLAYEYFRGVIFNPEIEQSERAKYKRMVDIYSQTQCYGKDCKNNSKGCLYCLECRRTKNPYKTLCLVNIYLRGPNKEPLVGYCVDSCGNKLLFLKEKDHMACVGEKVDRSVVIGESLRNYKLHGHDYKDIDGFVYNKYCTYARMLSENPLVIETCPRTVYADSLFSRYPDFCSHHREGSKGCFSIHQSKIPQDAYIVFPEEERGPNVYKIIRGLSLGIMTIKDGVISIEEEEEE